MSFKKRTTTAAFLLVLLFFLFQYASRPVFFLALEGVILAALVEFYSLARKRKLYPQRTLGVIMALVLSLSFLFPDKFPFMLALFACFLIQTFYYLFAFNTVEKLRLFPSSIAVTLFGALYVSFTLGYFYPLRFEWGSYTVYFLFGVIFVGDTGAYLVGRAIGRHKMAPVASPNKTWEGAVAGIVTACLAGVIGRMLLVPHISLGKAIFCAALVHAVAQASDPLESLFKRAVGVKDSSNMLPGHGGFLDRVDSLILAAPFFYYFINMFWK
jgi:phosphatidate cytidylyltransferase